MEDQVVRRLVLIVLMLAASALGIFVIGWLPKAGLTSGGMDGMMGQAGMPNEMVSGGPLGIGRGTGMWVVGGFVILAVIAGLLWALRASSR